MIIIVIIFANFIIPQYRCYTHQVEGMFVKRISVCMCTDDVNIYVLALFFKICAKAAQPVWFTCFHIYNSCLSRPIFIFYSNNLPSTYRIKPVRKHNTINLNKYHLLICGNESHHHAVSLILKWVFIIQTETWINAFGSINYTTGPKYNVMDPRINWTGARKLICLGRKKKFSVTNNNGTDSWKIGMVSRINIKEYDWFILSNGIDMVQLAAVQHLPNVCTYPK